MEDDPPNFKLWLAIQIVLFAIIFMLIGWAFGRYSRPTGEIRTDLITSSSLYLSPLYGANRGQYGDVSYSISQNCLNPITNPVYWRKKETTIGIITKYNPVEWQTDDTPDITASGERVREGIVANNCLPFNTIIEIDGKKYVVLDRMNKKYPCYHYDILTFDYWEAKQFGRQKKKVVIYYN